MQGAKAAVEAAQAMGQTVSKQYAEKLESYKTWDSLPANTLVPGTVTSLPALKGVTAEPLPLQTYDRFNVSIDPSMMIKNTRPYDLTEYSIVNQALAPIPVAPVHTNPTMREEMQGGLLGKGRRGA